jgi:hypothetical protein
MEKQADESQTETSMMTRRDRSLIALVEIGVAGLLVFSFFLPWFRVANLTSAGVPSSSDFASISWGEYLPFGLSMTQLLADFLIPLGALAAVAAALVGLALPGRAQVLAILVTFAAAGAGVILQFSELSSGNHTEFAATPSPGQGLWLFAGAAALGASLAMIDLTVAGSSTFVWRALREPSTKPYGLFLAWAGVVAIALVVALFPMFPRWWSLAPLALIVGPILWVRARRAR